MKTHVGKGILTAAAAAIAVLCALAARVDSQDGKDSKDAKAAAPSKSALQEMYKSYLAGEGYKPEIDEDGDIKYRFEGKTLWIIIDPTDLGYFRLVMLNVQKVASEAERRKALAAMDFANARTKVAKAYLVGDNVWICVEIFVAKPEDFKTVFSRCQSALSLAYANFRQKMNE